MEPLLNQRASLLGFNHDLCEIVRRALNELKNNQATRNRVTAEIDIRKAPAELANDFVLAELDKVHWRRGSQSLIEEPLQQEP